MANSKKTLAEQQADIQPKLAKGAKALQTTAKKEVRKRKPHGNSKFCPKKWAKIMECVATYGDLIEACDKPDYPSIATVYRWMEANPELKDDLRRAWDMFTMIGNSVNNNILRGGKLSTGDFRRDEALAAQNRWFMSKTNRRDFGDKQQVDVIHHDPVILDGIIIDGDGGDGV
jgi:hypothetical protein